MTVSILSNNRRIAPFGMAGGEPGDTGRNWLQKADASIQPLGASESIKVAPQDVIVIETPGGGGYGTPN